MIRSWPLLSYFLLAYLFTWAIEVPMALDARGIMAVHLPHWLEGLAAFGPFAAALIVLNATRGREGIQALFASLFKWRVPSLWLAAAVVSPFVIMFAALAMTGQSGELLSGTLCAAIADEGRWVGIIVTGGLLRGVGEEPGWRGFALPLLRSRFGPLLATLALWPVWACWHLPSFLMRPEFQLGAWIGFSFGILAAAAWSTLLYDKTRSVLMVAIWHALINITRTIAGSASSEAFFAFAQLMTGVGLLVIVYWLIVRPGTYSGHEDNPGSA